MSGISRNGPPLLTRTDGARELVRAVRAGVPYAAGKLGTSEFEILAVLDSGPRLVPKRSFQHITMNAGLFPTTDEAMYEWVEYMKTSVLPTMDLLVEWNPARPLHENCYLNTRAPKAKRTVLRALEPYYESAPEDQYTRGFPTGARVAVISPFAESVAAQKTRLGAVWPTGVWSADTAILPIQTGYNPAFGGTGWPPDVLHWKDAVTRVVRETVARGATHALVGCGAVSLPICAELKREGLVAIHTGGATQILFGIQGRRWDSHSIISTFYNEAWIRPAATEIPSYAAEVERGCYW
jgi:hypothetical protein